MDGTAVALSWKFVWIVVSVVLLVLAAFGVGDGDPNLAMLGLGAFFLSFLDVNGPRST